MPIKRDKLPKIVTPIGIAVFPKLNVPDTKYKAEGEFTTKLRLSGAEAAGLKKTILDFYEVAYEVECRDKDVKKLKRADPPFKQAVTRDGEDIEDTFDFNFKRKASGTSKAGVPWKAVISLIDAKKNPIKAEIWGGSKIRVSATMSPWYSDGFGFGIKLELRGVQVTDLVTRGGALSAEALGFGEVDGYNSSTNDEPEDGDAEGASDVDQF